MKEYTVVLNGVEHTMQLDDEDLKRYKAMQNAEVKEASKGDASTKSATPQNKARS